MSGTAAKAYSPRAQARHSRILSVVRRELAEYGYDGVTMNGLAEKSGVVKKTLYNLYGSKDELLLAAIGELISDYRNVTAAPGFDTLLKSREAAIELVLSNRTYSDTMTTTLIQAAEHHPLVKLLMHDAVVFTEKQLEAENQPLKQGLDLHTLAQQIVAQSWGTILLLTKGLIAEQEFHAKSLQGLHYLLDAARA